MTTSGSHPIDPADLTTRAEPSPRAAAARPDTVDAPARWQTYAHPAREDHGDGVGVSRTRQEATERQQRRFGGLKVGSAFFGWLTATGAAVLLTALVVAVGAAVGVSTGTSLDQVGNQAQQGTDTVKTVGLVGGIALLVVLLLAYFCGGYVAGRMARFNGLTQGLGVWLWTVVIAIIVAVVAVVAVVAAIAGSKYNVLDNLNAFPRIPTGGNLTTGGIIALIAVAVISLVGALLGGLAGMRFHRKVDQAAFDPITT